jgi:hypothetical protein
MRYQRTIILGGVLAAIVGAAVAGVAAQRDNRDRVFIGPDGAGRAIRLDGRGSQIGVLVSDPDAAGAAGVRIDGVDEDSPAANACAAPGS